MPALLALLTLPAALAHPHLKTISVDPLTTVLGFVHLQVEFPLSPQTSLYVSPSLRLYDSLLGSTGGDYRGYGLESGLRWFFTGVAPEGGWLMLRGVLAGVQAGPPARAGADTWGVGGYTSALAGYTAVLGPGLVLAGGAGISWFSYGVEGVEGIHGFLPALHTNIGWAF